MALEDIVQVTITSNSRGVNRRSFGIPLVVGNFTFDDASLVKSYDPGKVLAGIVADSSVAIGDKVYRTLQAVAAQSPKPRRVMVGAMPTAIDQEVDVEVISTAAGDYTLTIKNGAAAARVFTYTSPGGETLPDIATALAALVDADGEVDSAAAVGAVITINFDTSTVGEVHHFVDFDRAKFTYTDQTLVGSAVAELQAIQAVDDSYYGVLPARPLSIAAAQALAAEVETQEKIMGLTSYETGERDGTGMGATLAALGLLRTFVEAADEHDEERAAGIMSYGFSQDPGSITWAFKNIRLSTTDSFSATEETALDAANVNRYVEIAGLDTHLPGKMVGGEWIDVVRGRDWLVVRMRERVMNLLANAPKVPYTQAGADLVGAQIEAQLSEGIGQGYLSPDPLTGVAGDPPFTVVVPDVSEIDAAVKATRVLPDVGFTAGLAGAIHAVQIEGVIEV